MASKGGNINYKCRQCGEIFHSCHAPDVTLALQAIIFPYMRPMVEKWGSQLPDMHELHHCGDGRIGIADLIGGVEDKTDA